MRWIAALALFLVALSVKSASASDSAIDCAADKRLGAHTARYTCEVDNVRRMESIEFPARRGCDRFRAFYAEMTNGADSFGYQEVPTRHFVLRDFEGDDARFKVDVYVNPKRIKFINRSQFMVDVSYTERCTF